MTKTLKKVIAILFSLMLLGTMTFASAEGKTIEPLPHGYDPESLGSCTPLVTVDSLQEKDNTLTVTIWSEDLFDVVDVMQLQPGDIIVIAGQPVRVKTLENDPEYGININGGSGEEYPYLEPGADGISEEGVTLGGGEGGTYFVFSPDCYPVCTKVGTVTFEIPADLKFVDDSDPERTEPLVLTAADLIARIKGSITPEGDNDLSYMNTRITFEDGKPVEVLYCYTPWN